MHGDDGEHSKWNLYCLLMFCDVGICSSKRIDNHGKRKWAVGWVIKRGGLKMRVLNDFVRVSRGGVSQSSDMCL